MNKLLKITLMVALAATSQVSPTMGSSDGFSLTKMVLAGGALYAAYTFMTNFRNPVVSTQQELPPYYGAPGEYLYDTSYAAYGYDFYGPRSDPSPVIHKTKKKARLHHKSKIARPRSCSIARSCIGSITHSWPCLIARPGQGPIVPPCDVDEKPNCDQDPQDCQCCAEGDITF